MRIFYSNQEKPNAFNLSKSFSVFLAGPSPRTKEVDSWRPQAIDWFKFMNFNGTILVPEPSNGERYKEYDHQIEWEHSGLFHCDLILIWVPRNMENMLGLTTNFEMGYWLGQNPEKVIYGRPDDAPKNKYLDYMYTKITGKKPFNTLQDLVYCCNRKQINLI